MNTSRIFSILVLFISAWTGGGKAMALTLEDALERAESNYPELVAFRHAVTAATADAAQAGRWPNPVLEMRIEGYTPGSTNDARPDQQQQILGVSQPLPLAGVPRKQRRAGELRAESEIAALEAQRRALRAMVKRAFAAVLYRQETLQLMEEIITVNAQTVTLAQARAAQGDLPESDLLLAEAQQARLELEHQEASAALQAAWADIAMLMGTPEASLETCAGTLDTMYETFDPSTFAPPLEAHPLLRQSAKAVEAAEAQVQVEGARRWPMPEISAARRHFNATDQDTWDIGLRFSLPIFDRNRDARAAAAARASQLRAQHTATQNQLLTEFQKTNAEYSRLGTRCQTLREKVCPKVDELASIARRRFELGDISMFEVLNSQRAALDANRELLDTRFRLIEAASTLESIAGIALTTD